jgi:hypothetical protein
MIVAFARIHSTLAGLVLATSVAVTAHADPPAAAPTQAQATAILGHYLALHASLVAGDTGWAQRHAAALQQAAKPVPEVAKTVADYPQGLAAQRERFKAVSLAAIALAARFFDPALKLNVVHCGMADGR